MAHSIAKEAIYIALDTTISLHSLFRTAIAVRGNHIYWPAFPEGSLRVITPHTPELSAVSFLPWLPRTSDELDLQKSKLLASSSGQPNAPLYRLYISSSPLGVADSLQPHAVCHFTLTSRYIPHRQRLLPKAVPRSGIMLSPGHPVLPYCHTADPLMSLCPSPAGINT